MKLATVLGARPQFIKAAMVTAALRREGSVRELLVHTGQHYDDNMSQVFFDELDIPRPDFWLNVGSGTHGAQTGHMLEAVEKVLLSERPDAVLVYGDTNTTLAGALAAAKLHIPVAHVEAGLRSFNRRMPEEINRVLTDHLAAMLFAPTQTAVDNLRREGVDGTAVHLVGDVMYDSARHYATIAESRSRIVEDLGLTPKQYILATVHRAENTDDLARLEAIFQGCNELAREIAVVLPLHPRTRNILRQRGLLEAWGRTIRLIDPVGYLDMVRLESAASLIATDSGGVQKEAFFFQVPCVTLRDETEWVELVQLGWNRLAPPTSAAAVAGGLRQGLGSRGKPASPYGDGAASVRIAAQLKTLCP